MRRTGHNNAIIKGAGFHHVAYRSPDLDASVAFWVDVLGCKPKLKFDMGDGRYGVMIDIGDGNYIEVFNRDESEPVEAEARMLHVCLRCTNIGEVIERVRAAGCAVTVEPKRVSLTNLVDDEMPTAEVELAFFTGPDGQVIELMDCKEL